MPAYNCEDFILAAVDSVRKQTYENWELIVVDDDSGDSTAEILKKLSDEDERILYFYNEKNSGAAAARNKAVERASGRYLAFLDSDDLWKPTKLEKQIRFMEENGYSFTCTSYGKVDEHDEDLGVIVKAINVDYRGLLKNCPGNSTVIYDTEKLGKFTIPLIRKRNDYVMWLQVIKKAGNLYGIDEVLSSHRIGMKSVSSNKIGLIKYQWTVYRKIEELSVVKSAYLVGWWSVKTLHRLMMQRLARRKRTE